MVVGYWLLVVGILLIDFNQQPITQNQQII